MQQNRILVLGVGNILLHDEGVGVRIVEKLRNEYVFSPNVKVMDGGTLGLGLLDPISEADQMIVVDALQSGRPPGTFCRVPVEMLRKRAAFKNSIHQVDLLDILAYAEILGNLPPTVIIGIEPANISPGGLKLTERIESRMDDVTLEVLKEIERSGGWYQPRFPATDFTA